MSLKTIVISENKQNERFLAYCNLFTHFNKAKEAEAAWWIMWNVTLMLPPGSLFNNNKTLNFESVFFFSITNLKVKGTVRVRRVGGMKVCQPKQA